MQLILDDSGISFIVIVLKIKTKTEIIALESCHLQTIRYWFPYRRIEMIGFYQRVT